MTEVRETIEIGCQRREVWAALADFGKIAQWASNVDHSCLTTTAGEGLGVTRRVQVGRNALLERVVEWAPGEALAYALEELPPVVRSATNRWLLVDAGAATTVTLTSTIDTGPRPPQKAIARVVGRTMRKASRQMLDGLKAHVEDQR